MTELGELVAKFIDTPDDEDKCPFCDKARHPFASQKKSRADASVVSKPKDLGCKIDDYTDHDPPSTTARHHLISALQSYAPIKRLVRMTKSVDYDINCAENGFGLPTATSGLKYTVGSKTGSYGSFDDEGKQAIAYRVMEHRRAQWHLGHHAVSVEVPESWTDEDSKSDLGHMVSYDQEVIRLLLDLTDAWVRDEKCSGTDDISDALKKDMHSISDRIKEKLRQFEELEPWRSAPFFVSWHAFTFVAERFRTYSEGQDPAAEAKDASGDP